MHSEILFIWIYMTILPQTHRSLFIMDGFDSVLGTKILKFVWNQQGEDCEYLTWLGVQNILHEC